MLYKERDFEFEDRLYYSIDENKKYFLRNAQKEMFKEIEIFTTLLVEKNEALFKALN